jgi:hypothetical protein
MTRLIALVAAPLRAPQFFEKMLRPGIVIGCALTLIAAGSTTF